MHLHWVQQPALPQPLVQDGRQHAQPLLCSDPLFYQLLSWPSRQNLNGNSYGNSALPTYKQLVSFVWVRSIAKSAFRMKAKPAQAWATADSVLAAWLILNSTGESFQLSNTCCTRAFRSSTLAATLPCKKHMWPSSTMLGVGLPPCSPRCIRLGLGHHHSSAAVDHSAWAQSALDPSRLHQPRPETCCFPSQPNTRATSACQLIILKLSEGLALLCF